MNYGLLEDVLISLVLALALIVAVNVVGELAISPRAELSPPGSTGAMQEKKAPEADTTAPEAKAAPADLGTLLAAYDSAAGKKAFGKCKSCHTVDKGGKNRVGPNLWDIVGREKGSVEGFKYSDAMKQKGGAWTYDDLDQFLTDPRTFIAGTKMSIKGYNDAAKRAAIIGFLRALSDDPAALPE